MPEEMKSAYIGSFSTAAPEYHCDQAFAEEFMKKHFGGRLNSRSLGLIKTCFSHPSINKRHFAIDDPLELVDEDPDRPGAIDDKQYEKAKKELLKKYNAD